MQHLSERVIAKPMGGDVRLIRYRAYGEIFTDLQTDGRVLLNPKDARKIAKELLKWASKTEAGDATGA